MRTQATILVLAAALLCMPAGPAGRCAWGQETVPEGFVGRGLAPITEGDIAEARQRALLDAQGKALMEALGSLMPLEVMSKYYLTIFNLFLAQPQLYVERFKLVSENALLDTYQLTVEAFIQQEMLKNDLAALGILAAEHTRMSALVLMAEVDAVGGEEFYWWKPGMAGIVSRSQQKLEHYLQQGGASIIASVSVDPDEARKLLGEGSEPDPQGAAELARQAGARVAVVGKARLSPSAVPGMASIAAVQCDIFAAVYDAAGNAPLIQSATHALGQHLDEAAAADAAIDKACGAIAGQIMDILHMQMRAMHSYTLTVSFAPKVPAPRADAFPVALRAAFPDFEGVTPEIAADGRGMILRVQSRETSGRFLQRLYESGIPGYSVEVVSAAEQDIAIKVSGAHEGAQ